MLEQASRCHSDHNSLFLHFACESLTCAPVPTPSAESGARMRCDVQRAEAYQVPLPSELQQHLIQLIQHELDVDLLADKLVACLTPAENNTMPHARKGSGVHSRKNQACFDSACMQKGTCTTRICAQQHA